MWRSAEARYGQGVCVCVEVEDRVCGRVLRPAMVKLYGWGVGGWGVPLRAQEGARGWGSGGRPGLPFFSTPFFLVPFFPDKYRHSFLLTCPPTRLPANHEYGHEKCDHVHD